MTRENQFILSQIRERIKGIDPDAEVVLFGSRARGQEHNESDWDILILLNSLEFSRQIEKQCMDELFDLELEIGESISTFVLSKNDWETKHSVTPFYDNVKKEGILL